QFVQIVLTMIVLLLLPSPARSAMPIIAVAVIIGALAALLFGRALTQRRGGRVTVRSEETSRGRRILHAVIADLREGLLTQRAWLGILIASPVVVAGHAATFLIAARTAGATVSFGRLLPLALLALLASGVPANIGGWGPREGVAAWTFGVAGLGAAQGVATA